MGKSAYSWFQISTPAYKFFPKIRAYTTNLLFCRSVRDTPIIIVTSPSSSSGQFTTSSRGQSRTPSQRPQSGSRSRSDGTRLTPAQADYYRSPRYRAEPRFTPEQADYYMSPRYRAEPQFTPEQADYYRSPRYRRSTWTSTWHVCRVSARMTSCVFGRTASTQAATSSRCVFA